MLWLSVTYEAVTFTNTSFSIGFLDIYSPERRASDFIMKDIKRTAGCKSEVIVIRMKANSENVNQCYFKPSEDQKVDNCNIRELVSSMHHHHCHLETLVA